MVNPDGTFGDVHNVIRKLADVIMTQDDQIIPAETFDQHMLDDMNTTRRDMCKVFPETAASLPAPTLPDPTSLDPTPLTPLTPADPTPVPADPTPVPADPTPVPADPDPAPDKLKEKRACTVIAAKNNSSKKTKKTKTPTPIEKTKKTKKTKTPTPIDLSPIDKNNPVYEYIPRGPNGQPVQMCFVPFDDNCMFDV